MKNRTNKQRRKFLQKLALTTAGSSLLATQSKFQLMQAALAAPSDYSSLTDYKTLVCVFLFGGNDAFNMFVPYGSGDYQKYADIRQSLAIPYENLLPVTDGQYSYHPSMPGVQALYNEGKIAVVANAGNLVEPTSRESFLNGQVRLPEDLFSHSHQQEFWQTNLPPRVDTVHPGWGAKMARLVGESNSNPAIPPLITMSGNNFWQSGQGMAPVAVNPATGVKRFDAFKQKSSPPWLSSRIEAWSNILNAQQRTNLLEKQAARALLDTTQHVGILSDAVAQAPEINTPINAANKLAVQLRMAARLISVREILGMRRQVIFVSIGAWDTHGNQLQAHANLLKNLDEALDSFHKTTKELNVASSVTTFTASEFGRTLTVNGDGTDHGWGTHYLVMGDAVNGGQIYGEMPIIEIEGPDDSGNAGRIIPTTSIDQYGATLARWMGVSDEADLKNIFAHLENFDRTDLGFMTV